LLVLVGNKSDCERVVPEAEVRAFVEEKGLIYYETSAKKAVNVHEMFVGIAQQLTERKITNKQTNSHTPAKKLEQRQEPVRHSNCQC
jgi:GTPase SAR1 family protein